MIIILVKVIICFCAAIYSLAIGISRCQMADRRSDAVIAAVTGICIALVWVIPGVKLAREYRDPVIVEKAQEQSSLFRPENQAISGKMKKAQEQSSLFRPENQAISGKMKKAQEQSSLFRPENQAISGETLGKEPFQPLEPEYGEESN